MTSSYDWQLLMKMRLKELRQMSNDKLIVTDCPKLLILEKLIYQYFINPITVLESLIFNCAREFAMNPQDFDAVLFCINLPDAQLLRTHWDRESTEYADALVVVGTFYSREELEAEALQICEARHHARGLVELYSHLGNNEQSNDDLGTVLVLYSIPR